MPGFVQDRQPLRRSTTRFAAIVASIGLLIGLVGPVAAATPDISVGRQTLQKLTSLGARHMAPAATFSTSAIQPAINGPEIGADPDQERPDSENAAHVPAIRAPRPGVIPVVNATSENGFDGLNHFDQRSAGTGAYTNTQFSLEPPDQALCVGAGFVLESVNTAIRVRNAAGAALSAPVALNQFFGLAPEINRTTFTYGDFSSDPKCYYDTDTGRFFVSLLQIDIVPSTGAFGVHSKQLLAVSTTSDPRGSWHLYSFDTTDDGTNGTPRHASCPCFGDQPLIGADATGFYVTTNEFPISVAGFNGAQVYAMSKWALAAGTLPTVVHLDNLSQAEGPAYSMQPTTTPPGGAHASARNGTEYFLSALDFDATMDNRITLWALINTKTLTQATPSVKLKQAVLASEVYGQPPVVEQKKGVAPLDLALRSRVGVQLGLVPKPVHEKFNVLNSNDDRMNQTVYAGGKVWGAVNTVVRGNGPTRTGIAYFIVTPRWDGGLTGSIANQGYVALRNNSAIFPSIAANAAGHGIIAFTLVGHDYFPSAAYVRVDATHDPASVRVARWGSGAADGFTGETSQDPGDGGVERWGDYSAAVASANGSIWFATETINQSCTLREFAHDTTCGATRTILANWGTFIGQATP